MIASLTRPPIQGWREQQGSAKFGFSLSALIASPYMHTLPVPPSPARWLEQRGAKYDFSLLNRSDGAGWDLAKRLLCKQDQYYRDRLSVGQALLQRRYFRPEF